MFFQGMEGELLKNSPSLGRDARYQKMVSSLFCFTVIIALLFYMTILCVIYCQEYGQIALLCNTTILAFNA